jgi:PAS domain S-box-containing protein
MRPDRLDTGSRLHTTDDRERFRELFESLAVGVVVHAADGTIVSCNPAAESILGLSLDQMLGRTPTDPRWRALRADGSPFPGDEHPATVALLTGRPVRDARMHVALPDDARRWLSINAQPLSPGADGRARGVIASFADITSLVEARRRAEDLGERLALATGAAEIGIVEWDIVRDRVTLDAVAARLFDLPVRDEPFAAADVLARFESPYREALETRIAEDFPGRLPLGIAYWIRTEAGERRRVSTRSLVHRDATGRAVRLLGTVHDATAEAALQDAQLARVAAESESRAKSMLLARVSHDLRTPLNAILGFAQLLELSPEQPPAAIREQAGQIRAAGRHLLAVVTDLLDAARLDAGAMVVEMAPTPLEPLLDSVHALMTAEAGAAGIGLWREPAPGLTVLADATRLRQALCNLVANGIRYNREGGRVSVAARPIGDSVRIDVTDTGRGIATEDLERIFEPFQRLPSAAPLGGVEGTGLGLTICRGIVERMDGHITVQSRPGAGSVFSVYLKSASPG